MLYRTNVGDNNKTNIISRSLVYASTTPINLRPLFVFNNLLELNFVKMEVENSHIFRNLKAEAEIKGFVCACLCDIDIKSISADKAIDFSKKMDCDKLLDFKIKIEPFEKGDEIGIVEIRNLIRAHSIAYLKSTVRNSRLFCRFERFEFWEYLEDAPLETLGRLIAMVTDADAPPVYGFSTHD